MFGTLLLFGLGMQEILIIAFIVLIVISANASKLLLGGMVIVVVVILHNLCGLGLGWLIGRLRRLVLSVKYVSLVNLIADREVVTELVADTFSVANIRSELSKILQGPAREKMLEGYAEVRRRLGDKKAPEQAARLIVEKVKRDSL